MTNKDKGKDVEKTRKTGTTPAVTSPWDEMEQWLNAFGRSGWLHPLPWNWPSKMMEDTGPFEGRMPKVDMVERKGEVVIHAELPGVKKDDVEVTLAENTVTIEAHTSHEEKQEEKGKYYRREMSRGDFRRTLTLPCSVDEASTKASFADGVLELTLPKTEKTSSKKVKVD
ncbi:MAG: Hsp20/alpha crystallin family protein [Gammaproteobacteria bacterium]